MVITGEDVAVIVGIVGILGAGAGILIRFGQLSNTIDEQGKDLTKMEKKLEPGFVTITMCGQRQGACIKSVCDKVEEVKASVEKSNIATLSMVNQIHQKINDNEKDLNHKLSDISKFMGRIEGIIETKTLLLSQKDNNVEETRG